MVCKSILNQQVADKSIIRKSKKRRAVCSFKDNICGVDLAYMQLIRK